MRISRQFNLLTVAGLTLIGICILFVMIYQTRETGKQEVDTIRRLVTEEREHKLMDLVSNACAIIQTANFYEDAQKAISEMRFGAEGKNYFFAFDTDGMFFVHPVHPEWVGQIKTDLADEAGVPIIQKIIKKALEEKEGFITYSWPNPETGDSGTKLTYFKYMENWEWIVCTGIFMDDINAYVDIHEAFLFASLKKQIIVTALIIFAFICCACLAGAWATGRISRPIVNSVRFLNQASEKLHLSAEDNTERGRAVANSATEQAEVLKDCKVLLNRLSEAAVSNSRLAITMEEIVSRSEQPVGSAVEMVEIVNQSMKHLLEAGKKTDTILKNIEKIAASTHLLGINATIEAARKGRQGDAFNEVADQVRALANQTADLSKQTASILKENEKKIIGGAELLMKTQTTVQQLAENFSEIGSAAAGVVQSSRKQSEEMQMVRHLFRKMDDLASEHQTHASDAIPVSQELVALSLQMNAILDGLIALTGTSREVPAVKTVAPKEGIKGETDGSTGDYLLQLTHTVKS